MQDIVLRCWQFFKIFRFDIIPNDIAIIIIRMYHHMNLQYFCIFIYIWWLLKFFGCFFVKRINNKNPKILTKRPPVATTAPSGTQCHHWGIGIPGYTFGSSIQAEQSHHLPEALLSRWLQAVYRVFNERPHLQLYRKVAYIHYLFLVFWGYGQKRRVICRKLALWTLN